MKPTVYLTFLAFFTFIGIIIYNKGIEKQEKKVVVAPCEDTKVFQEVKENPNKLDELIIEKCTDNQK